MGSNTGFKVNSDLYPFFTGIIEKIGIVHEVIGQGSNKTFWMIIRHCVADSFVDYLELDKWMCKHLKKGYTKNRQISCQVIGSKTFFSLS